MIGSLLLIYVVEPTRPSNVGRLYSLLALICVSRIQALALKDMGKAYKLFMYAQEVAPAQGQHLLMVMVEKASGKFMAQVKTVGGTYSLFEAKVKAALGSL